MRVTEAHHAAIKGSELVVLSGPPRLQCESCDAFNEALQAFRKSIGQTKRKRGQRAVSCGMISSDAQFAGLPLGEKGPAPRGLLVSGRKPVRLVYVISIILLSLPPPRRDISNVRSGAVQSR